MTDIERESDQPEEGTQDIPPRRNPRHAFHVQGMQRKETGNRSTPPRGSGHGPQDPKDQQCIRYVQPQCGRVVPGGIQPKQLGIQHVRIPGQGVPVGLRPGRQRPGDPLGAEAVAHESVLDDEERVVVVDEIEGQQLAIDPERGEGEEGDDDEYAALHREVRGLV